MKKQARKLLAKLEAVLVDFWGNGYEAPEGWKQYPLAGLCYTVREGCVNDQSPMYNDESIDQSIINLFYCYYKAIRDTIEDEFGLGAGKTDYIKIVVEPSWEDTSFIIAFLVNKRIVLLDANQKAWHMEFETPKELAEALLADYQTMKQSLIEAKI